MKTLHKNRQPKAAGFTIVELLLATAVFSFVLLVALAAFLGVGHLFYKGVSLTSTQSIANQVINDMSNNMIGASSVTKPTSSGGYTYMCIGNSRYTYTSVSGKTVYAQDSGGINYNNGSSGGNYGLLKDQLPSNGSCLAPTAATLSSNGAVEMLTTNMRVANVYICGVNASTTLYNIDIVVAYGDNSALTFGSAPASQCGEPTYPKVSCQGNYSNQAFCSVVKQDTTAFVGART